MALYHLTLSGPQAGQPLCRCDRAAERQAGAQFMHAAWINIDRNAPYMSSVCPACLAILDSVNAQLDLEEIVREMASLVHNTIERLQRWGRQHEACGSLSRAQGRGVWRRRFPRPRLL
jgi:hypothetical protein